MHDDDGGHPTKRSAGALKHRRIPLPWPEDRDFRILSIDGGGIRGIYPAAFLAGLEERYLGGESVARYFDLITGTSTGGILALGLAAGFRGAELRDLYVDRGGEIFPPVSIRALEKPIRRLRGAFQVLRYSYDRDALVKILQEYLGDRKLGDSRSRLCIPSFDGRYGEVYIFKTPHHPDFHNDARELMTMVGAATAAAPTFFRPLEDGGYTFVDGGVWANNPIMIALVDALTCFTVPSSRIQVLSLGCGDDPYTVGSSKISWGGLWAWRDLIFGAMRLQSQNALGQAGLLIGPDKIVRVDPPVNEKSIPMDDWRRASSELPDAAEAALDRFGASVSSMFLHSHAERYTPFRFGDI